MGNKRFSCGVVTPHFDLSKVRYRLRKSYLIFKAKRGCANNKTSIYSWIINFIDGELYHLNAVYKLYLYFKVNTLVENRNTF